MKKVIFPIATITSIIVVSCSPSEKVTIPLSRSVELDDTYTII